MASVKTTNLHRARTVADQQDFNVVRGAETRFVATLGRARS